MSPKSVPSLACACASLRRASRAVTQVYDEELRAAGLKITQFTLLQVLADEGSMTQARLAAILLVDSTTLSRNVKVLEGNGWISGREGEDRRERHLTLTDAGRDVYRRGDACWKRAQGRLATALGGLDALIASADKVARAASRL